MKKTIKSKPPQDIEALDKEIKGKTEDIADLIKRQQGEYDEASAARETWVENQNKWYKRRYGIRPKQTFPWVGASNLHLPLQDKHIRKMKPEYVSVIYNVTPMCDLTPMQGENVETADNASWSFDWLLRNRMNCFADIVIATDKALGKGFAIVKTTYEKKTEPKCVYLSRKEILDGVAKKILAPEDMDILDNPNKLDLLFGSLSSIYGFDPEDEDDNAKMAGIAKSFYDGADTVEFTVDEVIYDAPKITVLDPQDIMVPAGADTVFDFEKCPWIDYKYTVSTADLKRNGITGKWNKDVVDELLSLRGNTDGDLRKKKYQDKGSIPRTIKQQQEDDRTGVSNMENAGQYVIHEVCMWYDSDGDGIEERHILEYAEDYQEKDLRFIKYPYGMMLWPYVKVPFELIDYSHYTPRGIVEILNPISAALNVQHNQKINRQTLATTPTLLYAPGKLNPGNLRFVPGQAVPVGSPVTQNAMYLTHPSYDGSFMNEEQILKSWAEEFSASQDFGIASPTNVSGGSKARTATEISQIAQSRVGVRQLDIEIFQAAWREVFKRVWLLWIEFGPEQVWTYVDMSKQVKEMKKETFIGNWDFSPNGRFGATDPVLESQKAFRRFELFNQDPYFDQYELRREMVAKDDPRLVKKLLRPAQQVGAELLAAGLAGGGMAGAPGGPAGPQGSPPRPQDITGATNAPSSLSLGGSK